MVLLVSALYAGCWAPQNALMNIVISYNPEFASHPYILYFWWGSHTIAMFHSIVNPFIYYWQNPKLREGVGYFLRCIPFVRFHGLDLLDEKKLGPRAVRYVNMVAYLPISGRDTVHHSSVQLRKKQQMEKQEQKKLLK